MKEDKNIQPLVSIIVPCYNQGAYLAEALDSVLAQTYTNWECIVVNDGSIDNSEEVAQLYVAKDKRFHYIAQVNQGVSVARNTAIQHSSGKYILPLDGDDLLRPKYVEKAVNYLEQNPEIKLFYSQVERIGAETGVWNLVDYDYETMVWKNIIVCTAMYRRADYDKTHGYNPNMRKGLEDWDFWLSFLSPEDKVYRDEEVLFVYRIKQSSRNADISYQLNRELNRQIVANHPEIYSAFLPDIINYHEAENLLKEAVAQKAAEIRASKPYRVGKMIIRLFKK